MSEESKTQSAKVLFRFRQADGGCESMRVAFSSVDGACKMGTTMAIRLTLGLVQDPAMTTAWHLWTVIVPRRTITGRLVRGQVWRRHDGRRWLYKKFSA
jgi:hypothetical protein